MEHGGLQPLDRRLVLVLRHSIRLPCRRNNPLCELTTLLEDVASELWTDARSATPSLVSVDTTELWADAQSGTPSLMTAETERDHESLHTPLLISGCIVGIIVLNVESVVMCMQYVVLD